MIDRRHLLVSLLAGLAMASAEAQISLSITTDRTRYIQFEPITVRINLRNYSGQQLDFGQGAAAPGYIQLVLKRLNGEEVPLRAKGLNPASGLILASGSTKSMAFTINEFYSLHHEDDYQLKLRVGHRRLPFDYESKPVTFQVRVGSPVWQQTVGVPEAIARARQNEGEATDEILTRNCSLRLFRTDEGDLFYLQIDDANLVYAITRLGPRVQGVKAQCDVDAMSLIHTLIQTAPRLFSYRVFDLDGTTKQSVAYLIEESVPRLIRDPDVGRVMVAGGRRAVEGRDYNIPNLQVFPTREEPPEQLFDN